MKPAAELPFYHFHNHKPATFVADLWWCEELGVWDVVVYRLPTPWNNTYEWICSGVALKRFVRVNGHCDTQLASKLSKLLSPLAR